MNIDLTDYAQELLLGLVRDERRDVHRGAVSYPDTPAILQQLDEAERALAGEAGLEADTAALLAQLAREEAQQIHCGFVSYSRDDNEAAAGELRAAAELLDRVARPQEVTA